MSPRGGPRAALSGLGTSLVTGAPVASRDGTDGRGASDRWSLDAPRGSLTVAMTEPFERATRPAQKEQRRAHLLATARGMLDEGAAPRSLSLNEIARRASMAKANVYRYFESREALLLALLWDEWTRWFDELRRGLARDRARGAELEGLVAALARSLARRPLLCALTAELPSVLEQNLGEATIGAFKRESLAFFERIARTLEARCPALDTAGYMELVHDAAHVIAGLFPATRPSEAAARALGAPDLRFFQRDFATELERFLLALAREHARRRADASAGEGEAMGIGLHREGEARGHERARGGGARASAKEGGASRITQPRKRRGP
jgi:AcrR family transcriptional regulator